MNNVLKTDPSILISVIVPFFNHSEWLVEALDSVVYQHYSHWEVIVMDDGSSEKHSSIAKEYCLRHAAQMTYLEHPGHINRGVTISRNVAISKSAGSLIALLDADDLWLPGKLLHQLNLFEQFPATQMICEASNFWYSWNSATAKNVVTQIGVAPDKLYEPPYLSKHLYPLGEGAAPCPSGIIIRRPAFDRAGGFEPAFSGENTLYEDQAFLAKMYLEETIYISGTANNLYRKRENSMSSGINDLNYYRRVRKFFLGWLRSYLTVRNMSDPEILALIQIAEQQLND